MPRVHVSLLGATLFALLVGSVVAADSTVRERPQLDMEPDPFENPEAFIESWNRFGGDGPLAVGTAPSGPEDDKPVPSNESTDADSTAEAEARPAAQAVARQTNEPAENPTVPEGQSVSSDAAESNPAAEATAVASDVAAAEPTEIAPPQPRKELSPEMRQLRDRVRYRLSEQMGQDYSVQTNTATDVLYYCLGFGRRAGVRTQRHSRPVSGIGCLCYNYEFRGYRPLTLVDDLPAARVGYGRQSYPSQMFAVLAQSRVAPDYPVRVGNFKAKVGNFVEQEKLDCRETSDLSLKLIGLCHYVTSDETWVSSDGETWSLDRVVRAEMDRPFTQASRSGVHRLMGLSYAVQRRIKDELPVDGGFARAQRYLDKFHDHALKLQNADGSWHPQAFRVRGVSRDTAGTLRSTGLILDWLVFSLPQEEVEDPRVARSVDYLTRLLGNRRYATGTPQLPTHEIAGVMHAVHALRLYDERVFKPADPPEGSDAVAHRDGAEAVR